MALPGPLLAAARRNAGLTQAKLARRLGISQAALAQLERPAANPRVATLERALQATGAELSLHVHQHPRTIDESLVRAQLELRPAERLEALETLYADARKLADAGARSRGELA